MRNEKFRKALDAYVDENEIQETYGDVIILEDHAYDNSIVGITDTGILVYDYNKMVEELAADEGVLMRGCENSKPSNGLTITQ